MFLDFCLGLVSGRIGWGSSDLTRYANKSDSEINSPLGIFPRLLLRNFFCLWPCSLHASLAPQHREPLPPELQHVDMLPESGTGKLDLWDYKIRLLFLSLDTV